jgi:hypothetical protein
MAKQKINCYLVINNLSPIGVCKTKRQTLKFLKYAVNYGCSKGDLGIHALRFSSKFCSECEIGGWDYYQFVKLMKRS